MEISAADGIVFVHPDWWGMPPAILKGWVDRVLRPGVAYRFAETDAGEGIPIGLLVAKAANVFNTSNTPVLREQEVLGDPLERLRNDCICSFRGIPACPRRMFSVVVTSTGEARKAYSTKCASLPGARFPRLHGNPASECFFTDESSFFHKVNIWISLNVSGLQPKTR